MTSGYLHAHIVRIIITHIYKRCKSMAAIVLKLRPKFKELRANETYSYEQVIDILCEFAQSLYPDMDASQIREIIIENF